ncbi:MAG: hypothetical protein NZ519_08000 [Bacteroidia bacterium]|nr:hypothetical protein [Bacteroidia bacterium]MDW8301507.1 hypothetical protein [Bacteroidia bacterium]
MFKYTESKNCKNQIKGIYELDFATDRVFITYLKEFGEVKVLDFTQFSPKSKVFFKVTYKDIYTIEGTLNENLVFFSCKKTHLQFKEKWEKFLSVYQLKCNK